MKIEESNILVSICCITYNHAPFIRKALDGFLMQEPPTGVSADEPWYEILIHDDCSTDGTTEIIKEYAAKYPDRIFPLYETKNQYSQVGTSGIDFFNYNRAKGSYIAYCEGDDYWTDAYKLQKQVDFMDAHPEYSVCFHNYENYDDRLQKQYQSNEEAWYKQSKGNTEQGKDLNITDYLHRIGQPLTMLFRVSMFDFDAHNRYKYYRDTHEIYHLLKAGKGYWMNFIGGMHICHDGGISAGVGVDQHCWEEREHILELYKRNRDKVLADYLVSVLLWNYETYSNVTGQRVFHNIMKKYIRETPLIFCRVYSTIIKRRIRKYIKK